MAKIDQSLRHASKNVPAEFQARPQNAFFGLSYRFHLYRKSPCVTKIFQDGLSRRKQNRLEPKILTSALALRAQLLSNISAKLGVRLLPTGFEKAD